MKRILLCTLFSFLYEPGVFSQSNKLVPFLFSPESKKWGYKDVNTGKVFIYWHFDEADSFQSNGYARVLLDGKMSYIDTMGKMVFPLMPLANLPHRYADTLYINSGKSWVIVRNRNDGLHYMYRLASGELELYSELPLVEQYYRRNIRVITFNYPKDQGKYELLEDKQLRTDFNKNRNGLNTNLEISYRGSLGKISFTQKGNETNAILHHVCLKRFLTNVQGNKTIGFSTGYSMAKFLKPSNTEVSYRVGMLTMGLVQRVSITDQFFVDFASHAVINRSVKTKQSENEPWRIAPPQSQLLSAQLEISANYKIDNITLGLGYTFNSPFSQNIALKQNFVSMQLGFLF